MTPEPSVQGVCDESNQVLSGGVLSREDIESLAVNLDELQKVKYIGYLIFIFKLQREEYK